MKTIRTTAQKAPVSGRKSPAALKPLPIPRLKPISAEKLREFQERFAPRPGAKPVDAVATLLRLRRSDDPPGLDTLALTIGPQMKARLTSEAKRRRRTPEQLAAELLCRTLDDMVDARIVRQRHKKPGRIYTSAKIERELGL